MLRKKRLEELGRIEGARGSIAVAQMAGGYMDYLVQQQRLHRRSLAKRWF
jgi:hypothetical protein